MPELLALEAYLLYRFEHVPANMLWQTVIALNILSAYGLYAAGTDLAPSDMFSYDQQSLAQITNANPALASETTYLFADAVGTGSHPPPVFDLQHGHVPHRTQHAADGRPAARAGTSDAVLHGDRGNANRCRRQRPHARRRRRDVVRLQLDLRLVIRRWLRRHRDRRAASPVVAHRHRRHQQRVLRRGDGGPDQGVGSQSRRAPVSCSRSTPTTSSSGSSSTSIPRTSRRRRHSCCKGQPRRPRTIWR